MIGANKTEDLSDKIKIALDKAVNKIIATEKARDGYMVISDKDGNIKKVPAKELLAASKEKK